MPFYTDLNDTRVDGEASSHYQGTFLGSFTSFPAASEDFEGYYAMYVGSSRVYTRYAFYTCVMREGVWVWEKIDLAMPYKLRPLMATQSDEEGNLISSRVTFAELEALIGITGNVQNLLDDKEPVVTGAASTVTRSRLTAARALISDAQGNIGVSSVTSQELATLKGAKSSVQDALDLKVDKSTTVNGHPLTGDIELTAEDVGAVPSTVTIPKGTSDLVNDAGFIKDDTVSLENYYLKAETYTRAEVDELVAMLPNLEYRSATELPAQGEYGYIYLIPADEGWCRQYVWGLDGWIFIGTTEVIPEVSQTEDGIIINSVELQKATEERDGLMRKEHVSALREARQATVTGFTMDLDEDNVLTAAVTRRDGSAFTAQVQIPVYEPEEAVRDRNHTLEEMMVFSNGTYIVDRTFEVEVLSAGMYGETNMMVSTVKIPSGAYVCMDGRDFVFSNQESNTRVGTRVLAQHDGTVKVFDCNGIEVTSQAIGDVALSDTTCYRVATE